MTSEKRDARRARVSALRLPKLAAATLIAALALAVGGGGCAPAENAGDSDPASMSAEHAVAQLYTCAMFGRRQSTGAGQVVAGVR